MEARVGEHEESSVGRKEERGELLLEELVWEGEEGAGVLCCQSVRGMRGTLKETSQRANCQTVSFPLGTFRI